MPAALWVEEHPWVARRRHASPISSSESAIHKQHGDSLPAWSELATCLHPFFVGEDATDLFLDDRDFLIELIDRLSLKEADSLGQLSRKWHDTG
jgi:hypothetical protein